MMCVCVCVCVHPNGQTDKLPDTRHSGMHSPGREANMQHQGTVTTLSRTHPDMQHHPSNQCAGVDTMDIHSPGGSVLSSITVMDDT